MKLSKLLNEDGYHLIDGLVRNHKPLQLWYDGVFKDVDILYGHLSEALKSSVLLTEVASPGLNVDFSKKNEYNFNIGATVLDSILKSLGLGTIELSTKFSFGKSISIGFDNTVVKEYTVGNLNDYLESCDFAHYNPTLLKNANRDNLILLTSVIYAENLVIELETTSAIDVEMKAKISTIIDGKLSIGTSEETKLTMTSTKNVPFPIAVKPYRLDFDGGRFKKMKQMNNFGNKF